MDAARSADFYDNTVKSFVTDLLPFVNPAFAPYAPPAALSPQAQAFALGATGVFVGEVPSYTVVDLHASWALRRNVTLGMTGTNVLDDEHYEIFGGDLLQRRLLGYVTWSF